MAITSETVASLPHRTGVYLIRDVNSSILYVGKAKDLKKRFSSYLQKERQGAKVQAMLSMGVSVETVITETEKEALILECNLIKRYHPKYNVILRDDKNYLSLRIDPREKFPHITMVRRTASDGALYFGPFSSAASIRDTLRTLQKIFPMRRCTDAKFKSRIRPCLNYQMKRCLGPCTQAVSEGEYKKMVEQVILFFRGKLQDLIRLLEKQMHSLASQEEFENAALCRDRLAAIRRTLERQTVSSPYLADEDVIGLYREGATAQISVLFVRNGAVIAHKSFTFRDVEISDEDLLSNFLKQFYDAEKYIPQHILIPLPVEDQALIAALLGEKIGKRVSIAVPKRGERRHLLALALENSQLALCQKTKIDGEMHGLLDRLQGSLRLAKYPRRIEALDISNMSGKMAVGSVVVFIEGVPERSLFRRYKIRLFEEANDYGMMREVVSRRLRTAQKEDSWPNLLLVDGGKGQLNIALQVLSDLGCESRMELIALAKGDKSEVDKVYLPRRKNPVIWDKHSPLLHCLQQVRDEAHRFAIDYHRRLRKKRLEHSVLDNIPGIGKVLRKRLLSYFGSVDRVREAPVQQIASVQGISAVLAQDIKSFLLSCKQ